MSGPQKFHTLAVPRIGGIGIYLELVITALFAHLVLKLDRGLLLLELSVYALPAFLIGLIEDLQQPASSKETFDREAVLISSHNRHDCHAYGNTKSNLFEDH